MLKQQQTMPSCDIVLMLDDSRPNTTRDKARYFGDAPLSRCLASKNQVLQTVRRLLQLTAGVSPTMTDEFRTLMLTFCLSTGSPTD